MAITREDLCQVCDPGMLRAAVISSRLAYSDNVILQSGQIGPTRKFHAWYSSATSFLVRGSEYDVLVWRGTKEPLDFLIDAMAIPVYYKGSWCHAGFAYSHATLWRKIRKHIDPDKPILLTGHSLGGSGADKSVDCLEDHRADVHMITFGKPNVHLKEQDQERGFLKTHLSVVSGSDIITRLPRYLYGPHPLQDMLYFANDGYDYIDPSREFRKADFSRAEILSDHSIENEYEARVERLLAA